jgi:RES domain-containing protein
VRIYRLAFGNDLTRAFTATLAYGRWNHKNTQALYLSEHPALAALEILNYWRQYSDFSNYYLFALELPEAAVDKATIPPTDLSACRDYGTAWLNLGSNLALEVLSVASPEAYNYVINPKHPLFLEASRTFVSPFNYDERVLEMIKQARRR